MSEPVLNLNRDSLRVTDNAPGGLIHSIKIALPEEIAVFPKPNGVSIEGAISFKTNGGFRDWHHTPLTGQVRSEVAGQNGGQCFRNRIEFTVPSNEPELLMNVMGMLNRRVIAIGKDTKGRYRAVGTLNRPAVVRSNTSTGVQRNNRQGANFVIEAYSILPAPYYTAGSPMDITNPPNTPVGGAVLALENALYFDASTRTGKMGGKVIEDTFIDTEGHEWKVSNRSAGFIPGELQHKEEMSSDDEGWKVKTKGLSKATELHAQDGVFKFKVGREVGDSGPVGEVKYDIDDALPNPLSDGPGSLLFLRNNLASIQFVRNYVEWELLRRGVQRLIWTINFNGGATGVQEFTIEHNLNTRRLHISLYDEGWNKIEAGVQLINENAIKIITETTIPAGNKIHLII